jgi:hypothetical protein
MYLRCITLYGLNSGRLTFKLRKKFLTVYVMTQSNKKEQATITTSLCLYQYYSRLINNTNSLSLSLSLSLYFYFLFYLFIFVVLPLYPPIKHLFYRRVGIRVCIGGPRRGRCEWLSC